MTVNELLKKISKGDIQHFYFLHGSERVYQKQVLQALTVKLVTEDNRDFNFEEFDGRYSSVHQWIDAAKTIPFMGGTKLVFVENMHDKFTLSEKDTVMEELKELLQDPDADEIAPDASRAQQEQDIGALIDYANSPIEGACLVIASGKVDRRRQLLKKLADGKGSVCCEAPKEYTLVPWVIDLAKEQGYSMSKDSAEVLVGRVGFGMESVIDPISLSVQFVVDPISLPVQPVCRSMAPIILGLMGFGMELIIDQIFLQSLYNTVTNVLLNSLLS